MRIGISERGEVTGATRWSVLNVHLMRERHTARMAPEPVKTRPRSLTLLYFQGASDTWDEEHAKAVADDRVGHRRGKGGNLTQQETAQPRRWVSQQELETWLWLAANGLRGPVGHVAPSSLSLPDDAPNPVRERLALVIAVARRPSTHDDLVRTAEDFECVDVLSWKFQTSTQFADGLRDSLDFSRRACEEGRCVWRGRLHDEAWSRFFEHDHRPSTGRFPPNGPCQYPPRS